MSLIKFKNRLPWFSSELSNFLDTDDFFSDEFWAKHVMNKPALNIKETEEAFDLEVAAPGLSKEDFNISIDDGYLNISAEKTLEKEEQEDNFTRKEFNFNSFKRSLLLPKNVIEEEVKAHYEDGILRLVLQKKEVDQKYTPRKIAVS